MKEWNPIGTLARTARNSPWLVMSITAHGIAIAILSVVYMQKERKPEPEDKVVFLTPTRSLDADEVLEVPRLDPIIRTIVPPDRAVEIVTEDLAFDVVDPPTREPDYTQEVGDPNSTSDFAGGVSASGAIGVGTGGSPRGIRPNPFGPRPGLPGLDGPQKGDPRANDPTQRSVLEGLRWLARHQNPDGSWGGRSSLERCVVDRPCADPKAERSHHYDEGLTGMALLCFLGAGFTHDSKAYLVDTSMAKKHVLGDVVKSGLMWLKNRQNQDGSFSRDRAFLYNEALATMAMAEAYGLSQNRYWKESAQRGVDFLEAAQRPSPAGIGLWGWRYASRADVEQFHGSGASMDAAAVRELYDSDTSVTGWAVMALKSAELSGLSVDPRAFAGARSFCEWVTADDGRVGYIDPKGAGQTVTGKNDHFTYHPTTMSALGMCIRIFAEHDPDDPFLELAAKRIVADLPTVSRDKLSVDYYYWYYASLALNQLDGPDSPRKSGKYWGPWNKAMVDAVCSMQDKGERTCGSGGWLFDDRWAYAGGPVYSTAINVLTLEVYYRYENAFGAGNRSSVAPKPELHPKMLLAGE